MEGWRDTAITQPEPFELVEIMGPLPTGPRPAEWSPGIRFIFEPSWRLPETGGFVPARGTCWRPLQPLRTLEMRATLEEDFATRAW